MRKVQENGTIDSSKHSHIKLPTKNPECEIANTPYLKVVGIFDGFNTLYIAVGSKCSVLLLQ